jgi:hypothetical protein
MDDDAIRTLVNRLARPAPSGGTVIERAALLAEGADFDAVMRWIVAHGGEAEANVQKAGGHGLHGSRLHASNQPAGRPPTRFVLPAGALD